MNPNCKRRIKTTTMTTAITSNFSAALRAQGLTFKTFTLPLADETPETFTMVNYKRDKTGAPEMPEARGIRGWMYDSQGTLIAKGFPYTPSEVYNAESLYEGQFQFLPQGAVVRLNKYGGKVFYSTFGSMRAESARYGQSENFKTLLLRYLNLTEEQLEARCFGDQPFSDVVHVFVVCDAMIMPTFQFETRGFVYYSGAFKQDIPQWAERTDVDREIRPFMNAVTYDTANLDSFWELMTTATFLEPVYLTTQAAETLLQEEEISVLLVHNGQGTRILSESEAAREVFVDNQPNLELRVCTLLNFNQGYSTDLYEALGTSATDDSIENRMEAFLASVCVSRSEEAARAVQKIMTRRDELIRLMTIRFKTDKIKIIKVELSLLAVYINPTTYESRPDEKLERQFTQMYGRFRSMEKIAQRLGRNGVGAAVFEDLMKRENSESLYRMLTKSPFF